MPKKANKNFIASKLGAGESNPQSNFTTVAATRQSLYMHRIKEEFASNCVKTDLAVRTDNLPLDVSLGKKLLQGCSAVKGKCVKGEAYCIGIKENCH